MNYLKASLGFSKYSDVDLERAAQSIADAMSGNASYPTPPVTIVDLQAAITAFSVALANQWSSGPVGTSTKNDKRAALVALLSKNGSYVQIEANSDLTVLLSSGYKAITTTHTVVPLGVPTLLKVVPIGEGTLMVKAKSVPHAKSYEVRYILNEDVDPTNWHSTTFPTPGKMDIIHLLPGKVYRVQIRAIGGLTVRSEWCAPFTQMAT